MKEHRSARWHRLVEPVFLFPAIGVLLLLLVWAGAFSLVRAERLAADRALRTTTLDLVDTYEAQIVRALRELEFTLALVDFTSESRPARQTLSELEQRNLLPPDLLFTVSIVDDDDRVIASTALPEGAALEVTPGLEVTATSRPALLHRPRRETDGDQWWIDVSAALRRPETARAARVIVSVDAGYFVSSYEDGRLGQRGALGMVADDQTVLAARLGDVLVFNEPLQAGGWIEVGEGSGVVRQIARTDQERRYIAVRPVFGWPLVLATGVSIDEQMAGVNAEARRSLLGAAGISVLLAGFLVLLGRMSHQLNRSRALLMDEQRAHAEEARHQALHDWLTGLPNRSLFSQLMSQRINEVRRDGGTFAVMFLDLDEFKHINDTLGHEAGDRLLQEVSSRVQETLRESDVLARMGGDEFVILLRNTGSRESLEEVAGRMLDAVSHPYRLAGRAVTISVSIGISVYPRDGQDEQTLLRTADEAMYVAKQEGRNGFCFHQPGMSGS